MSEDGSAMPVLPDGWAWRPLGHGAQLVQTGPFGSQIHAEEYVDDGVPLINPSHLVGGQIVPDAQVTVDVDVASRLSRHLLQPGDLVFARRGELGRCALTTESDLPALCGTGSLTVRMNYDAIEPRFTLWWLSTGFVAWWLQRESVGSTMANLNSTTISRIPLPLPSVGHQRAIADFLDRKTAAIDGLIAKKERLIELLAEEVSAQLSMELEMLGRRNVKLGYVVDLLPGYSFPSAEFSDNPDDVPLLRGVNVGTEGVRWDDTVYWRREDVGTVSSWLLRPGDIVLGMDRPWISSGIRLALVRDRDCPCLLLQRVARLRPRRAVSTEFVMLLLRWDRFREHVEPEVTGVSVPHISGEQILSYRVPIPSVRTQDAVVTRVDSLRARNERLADLAKRQIERLREYRQALITAAVTGKIDVTRDEATAIPDSDA